MRFARALATAFGLAALLGACQGASPLAPDLTLVPSFSVEEGHVEAVADDVDEQKKKKKPKDNVPGICTNPEVLAQLPDEALKAVITNVCGLREEEPKK